MTTSESQSLGHTFIHRAEQTPVKVIEEMISQVEAKHYPNWGEGNMRGFTVCSADPDEVWPCAVASVTHVLSRFAKCDNLRIVQLISHYADT